MPSNSLSAATVHQSALVIDTHADTPQRFLDEDFDLADPLNGGNFNLESARQGNLAAEFFAIWAEPEQYAGQFARRTLALLDAVKKQVARHPDEVSLVTSPEGIEQARREHKLAIVLAIEGGHSIENSISLLREYYALGARYMTLTWANSNDWADSSGDEHDPDISHTANGLTEFGEEVIREMNRLGMMVDISHVSDKTFYRTLIVSRAPVVASHSSARAICDSSRNLTDDMIRAVANSGGPASKGGVVQVNFYSGFLSQEYREALSKLQPAMDREIRACKDRTIAAGRAIDYEEIAHIRKAAANQIPRPPFELIVDHIDHIIKVAGVDHVGIGSDFDGVSGQLPAGMDSPADLPKITEALMARGYSPEDCHKILGENFMRVFREVQAIAKALQ